MASGHFKAPNHSTGNNCKHVCDCRELDTSPALRKAWWRRKVGGAMAKAFPQQPTREK